MGMAVSEDSGCEYCLQSHLMLGTRLGNLEAAKLELNRHGDSSDPKRGAAVRFAKTVADTRGKVSDGDIAAVGSAGFSDGDIVAISGLTAQFLFTNFLNNIAKVDLDFPADVPGLRDTAAVPAQRSRSCRTLTVA
jgi:AhpD family alkylhydroperoxidase